MTLDECNAALRDAGHKEFIAKARKGYYYFTGGNTLNWQETGIYDNVAPLGDDGKPKGYILWSPEWSGNSIAHILFMRARMAEGAGTTYQTSQPDK
jgi:hypothetical protein